ncbi:uncharacterized protein LOC119083046 isoform X2 [Bradysia coprophila]|uniref:uncharacterized protein LOC119083046 isoform X2 n=1 Tax=Bradysia coprophila TaxID=38358 RepID=UPI00187D8B5C|nr:uncharacterized protein LOC119083046 isoform X2 [Bradysia coprophila]
MLLQSGQNVVSEYETVRKTETAPTNHDNGRYLDLIQDTLKEGWSVHANKDGRLYYCNHITRSAAWLPPAENWGHNTEFPYGWEKAIDSKNRSYYINHQNKCTTYEPPDTYRYDEKPPEPRLVVLNRSPTMGFGFVAGSERPVIVRFVTEGGPSVNKLEPGDRILSVNNEDVKEAPRDHVIQLVRSCESQVSLLVCQPSMSGCAGRKSTLLSAGKKAKLRTRPNRVRFAESVCVNGSPLFPPSAFSLGDLCVPPMANVLKVFLENGQTKSFKYDNTTTVQDVVTSLRDKLCLSAEEHFSLVLEHVKSLKRNKLTLLDPQETLARIAARPGAHKLRCLFRVTFVPVSSAQLAQKDLNALDYLFMQSCNDVTQERFSPELQADVALRLAALHIHQHSLANNISPAKLTVKTVEREFGLERFVPASLIDGMKRKELRRLMAHFLKLNSQMTGSSKMLTQLQAKIHYLDIISGLPSYGAKCFSTNQRDGVERVLLISPRFGLSQIAGVRNSVPQPICNIEHLTRVVVTREDDVTHSVSVHIQPDKFVTFSMEDRDACEFHLVLAGYHKLLTGKELLVEKERDDDDDEYPEDNAPPYLSQHSVFPANWSYLPSTHGRMHSMAFFQSPPYQSVNQTSIIGDDHQNHCDRNMNTTLSNNNHKTHNGSDDFGLDLHSVMTMEILERAKGKPINGLVETRNEEVLRRVAEMQRMVESSEKYLNEHGELVHEYEVKANGKVPWNGSSIDMDSDCESMSSSKVSSNEDAPGVLRHSDSLILLAESINLDLNGMTKGLSLLGSSVPIESSKSHEGTPKAQRRVQGLSQLLNDLHAISNDLSQSESDSESVSTPNSSPIHRNQHDRNNHKSFRSSFGLHSPDSSVLGPDSKDTNLKEYLRQLKEASNNENTQDIDLAAKKLTELYGFEIGDDTFIENDPDVIDLTAIPPPQTPDELDALSVISSAPRGFDDPSTARLHPDDNFEKFLAQVVIAPPTQKVTPAKELTPEEIMSYIIPPPPGLSDEELRNSETEPIVPIVKDDYPKESLYSNSLSTVHTNKPVVLEYATVERKGPFSCCTKSKKVEIESPSYTETDESVIPPPPRRCEHSNQHPPPERPPKSVELQSKLNASPQIRPTANTTRLNGGGGSVTLPPRKPNVPPVPLKPIFRNPVPLPKNLHPESPVRLASIGSPNMNRHVTNYSIVDRAFTSSSNGISPIAAVRNNGHYRSFSDSPPACMPNASVECKPQLSLLCSPQMSRKIPPPINSNPTYPMPKTNGSSSSSPVPEPRNGHVINVINVESLLAKTDVAMAGLLFKLDQIAAQCSAAQAAGGGVLIDEEKFQKARDELTERALHLVTASKFLVIAMSNATGTQLPEHLTSCLTALRRITELAQDMTKHTSAPLQTRNIVLKVHDVASSFRELAGVETGPFGAGPLALQAECLANVLATLLRSLRVFSP